MDINILIFGDSIAYGAWDKELGGWVNRLRVFLDNDSDNYYHIYNMGIPGDDTNSLKERFNSECKIRYKENYNNIIVFGIGVNDTQDVNGKDRTTLENFKENINCLINSAKKYTDNILFVGLSRVDESKVVPLPWNQDKSYFNHKIKQFDKELERLCVENNVEYLNVFDLLVDEELSDGLHPTSEGHQKLFEEVKIKVLKYNNFIDNGKI